MWVNQQIIADVNRHARVFYVDWQQAANWNAHRREGEPRLMTGWCWTAKNPNLGEQHGLKTVSACYIDAYYALVLKQAAPRVSRARLRVVA